MVANLRSRAWFWLRLASLALGLLSILTLSQADELVSSLIDDDDDWEFEPRAHLVPDSSDNSSWSLEDNLNELDFLDASSQDHDDVDTEHQQQVDDSDPHLDHNYLDPNKIQLQDDSRKDMADVGVRLRNSANGQNNCTQFRVDTREAIICDSKRCDKLKFEWPSLDNQIAIIQTTKHGMRFHRYDLAMQKASDRIKIDIIEQFLKPKPSTTTTTTTSKPNSKTTTTTTKAPCDKTTTPEAPQPTSAIPTTAQEDFDITTTDSPETDPPTTITVKPDDANDDGKVDPTNSTKLVTTLRIDTRRVRQQILGFGGALSDSTCRNIRSLSPEMGASLMEDYFGANGLRYSFARLSIGSSDFSTTPYTNNDAITSSEEALSLLRQAQTTFSSPKSYEDLDMKNFRATSEDMEFKMPLIRQAMATSHNSSELKLFASLWSPPTWMKNNSHIVHGYLKGDVYGPYYKALSDYIVKWLELYRRNGIEFWGTTGLNEPVTGIKPFIFHNSLGITKRDYITFMKLYLGPMLRQRGFSKLKLMLLDDNKGFAPNYVKSAFQQDPELERLISGVAIHWYMNDEYENLDFMSRMYSNKFVLSSEACNGYLPFQVHALPGDWDRGVAYAYDVIKTLQKGASGWVDWNMALDLSGGPSWAKNNLDAPVIVNGKRDEYYKSPMFYALGHFSRFVEPNSRRLDHRLAYARFDLPLETVAFMTPQQTHLVVVCLNANRSPVPLRIFVDKRLIRSQVTLRADSITTIVFKWKPLPP